MNLPFGLGQYPIGMISDKETLSEIIRIRSVSYWNDFGQGLLVLLEYPWKQDWADFQIQEWQDHSNQVVMGLRKSLALHLRFHDDQRQQGDVFLRG